MLPAFLLYEIKEMGECGTGWLLASGTPRGENKILGRRDASPFAVLSRLHSSSPWHDVAFAFLPIYSLKSLPCDVVARVRKRFHDFPRLIVMHGQAARSV